MTTPFRSLVAAVLFGLGSVAARGQAPLPHRAGATSPMEMCAFFSGRWTYEPRWSPDDPNVSILQSLRLVDELLPRGKRFEFEIYPGELHFFTRASSWIDAFGKMERFFGTEVRGESGTLAQPSSN